MHQTAAGADIARSIDGGGTEGAALGAEVHGDRAVSGYEIWVWRTK
jgi:hypothetical protein